MDFLDLAFTFEKCLDSLKSSYLLVSFLEVMSFVCYALILQESIWFSVVGIFHPARGIVGFFLANAVPTSHELIGKI